MGPAMLFIDIDKIKGVESKEGKSLKGYETDVHRSSRNRKVWEGGREREKRASSYLAAAMKESEGERGGARRRSRLEAGKDDTRPYKRPRWGTSNNGSNHADVIASASDECGDEGCLRFKCKPQKAGGCVVKYPIANRGDCTLASSIFLNSLTEAFGGLRKRLRRDIPMKTLKRWAEFMASCYGQETRQFHSLGHVMKLCEKSTPIQKIATLFHDVAYYQVDNSPPPGSSRFLDDVLTLHKAEKKEHIYVVTGDGGGNKGVLIAMKTFCVKMGQKLDPSIGLNEFASAVIGSRLLLEEEAVPLDIIVEMCAVIEGTIPFRKNQWTERLYVNLLEAKKEFKLTWNAEQIESVVKNSVELANRDVGDFGEEEILLFLEGTWDLLVENNPRIRMEGERCPIQVYRSGLQKTHIFLSTVATNLIYSKFRDTPTQKYFEHLSENAAKNVEVSRIYSGMKYALCLLIESLERLSGRVAHLVTKEFDKTEGSLSSVSTKMTEKASSLLRVLMLHRSIKHSRIDEALTHLSRKLLAVLDGDLDQLEKLLSSAKGHSSAKPTVALSKEEASSILKSFPPKFVTEVKDLFSF
mmetsp:Transcript_13932/g.26792  ORF Transcript_13932/g.26792 Transcript_13932/m.26792 type:complete len:582 (-) Transcript_13932:98-1843(-)|eukprot:CAMPEP_0197475486 /NCGR_PEP_ID=MMETSP1309-20131121/6932_1 /TAXON_ID=464262 /ORGANISM="Genus nov. species nov., Strain RCC998" /LENGTH=581 /DNA_ID=CAMNT_0043015527 /DNA_START=512 /DNA_END=2257 /DNA_ORIENTATION=-